MGWTYNIVDPDDATNAPTIAGVGIFFTILSLSIVCLRLYVRKCIVKAISIDDWIIVATWFLSFIFVSTTLAQTRWGLGLHNADNIPSQNLYEFGSLQYAAAPFYILAILSFKLSILFAFLRMAVDRTYRIGMICISITCSTFYFCYFVAQLNLCTPVAKAWNPTITTGSCLPAVPFYTTMAAFTFIFDILTMLTPIPILLHSTFSPRKNIAIALLFLLAIFTSLIQIPRITSLHSNTSTSNGTIQTWSLLETNLGIILSSLLPLSSLPSVQKFLEKGSPQSLSSFDTRRTIEKVTDGVKRRLGRDRRGEWRNRIVLFLGYGELRPDLEREERLGSGKSADELGYPMGILKTTEVIISREGSSWGERDGKEEEDV